MAWMERSLLRGREIRAIFPTQGAGRSGTRNIARIAYIDGYAIAKNLGICPGGKRAADFDFADSCVLSIT
jgi:hypothetical protein